MLPYSRPSKRTKKVLSRIKTVSSDESTTPAVQDLLQIQLAELGAENEELESPNSVEVDESEFEHDTIVAQESVVAGLARRVDESTSLTISFHEAILLFPALKDSGRKALSRRVPTRWNSDHHASDDHIYFRQPIQWLMGRSESKLQHYRLKEDQWPLAEEWNEALEVFEVPTAHFSAGSVPLVHETLSKLVELKETLEMMRDSTDISPVTRIGAQAALNVYGKYMDNMSICEVYFISLVMCPEVKLN
ncbi:hypothetical protein RhiJN_19953 [Ceratobasidium sp. AG-Ba]|nr:hypothetical protein RhiJN_19953 [Ceratobasidium sp. AG-Ba]